MKKNPTVGLPEVSKLIDSAISKRQGDRRKHSFLERKKILHKRENGFTMSTQNITSLDGSSYEAIHSSISQNIFSYLKMFSIQCRKDITVEDNKKRMNIANFINIYTNIYTYIICDERMTQNKNDSINAILQHGRVVDNNCSVVFPTTRFPYLILCPR